MLVPGLTFVDGRVSVTLDDDIVPDYINQGFGFMDDGSLAVDTAAPTGNFYTAGFRQSESGALCGVDEQASTPSHSIQGLNVEGDGSLIYDGLSQINHYVN